MPRGPVVGHVLSVWTLPTATDVRLAHVDAGHGVLQIVFGGRPVLVRGCLAPVAPPGHRVARKGPHCDVKMRSRRYRGVVSQGMLCSLTELGWVDDGPDEVPILCRGAPGDELPPDGDPFRWLSDESLSRLVLHEPARPARAVAEPVGQTAAP